MTRDVMVAEIGKLIRSANEFPRDADDLISYYCGEAMATIRHAIVMHGKDAELVALSDQVNAILNRVSVQRKLRRVA